jgi:hypothetical protein
LVSDERALRPERHEFEGVVPDGSGVRGYVTSYEERDPTEEMVFTPIMDLALP